MISFSFSLAFFLGREVALKGRKDTAYNNPLNNNHHHLVEKPSMVGGGDPLNDDPSKGYPLKGDPSAKPTQKPASHTFSKDNAQQSNVSHNQVPVPASLKKAPQKLNKKNPSTLPTATKPALGSSAISNTISKQQVGSHHSPTIVQPLKKKQVVQYFILITRSAVKDQAINNVSQLKLRFPAWDLFVRKAGKMYNIYVGPFQNKVLAKEFLKEMKKTKEFSKAKIKKIVLRKKN